MIEDDEVSVRWYSNNGSLIIKGEKDNGLQSRLLFRVDRGKGRWVERSVSEDVIVDNYCELSNFHIHSTNNSDPPKNKCCSYNLDLEGIRKSVKETRISYAK